MVIIIDAYNMLKHGLGNTYISEAAQQAFLDELWHYSQRKRHNVVVVFDGGPEVRPFKIVRGLLEIMYAGRQRSADDVIKDLLLKYNPANTLLVTSDRALRTYASRHQFISLESPLFRRYSKLQDDEEPIPVFKDKHAPVKRHNHESSVEVDALMQKAGRVTFVKKEDYESDILQAERTPQKKLSKYEKKRAYFIEKL